MERSRKRKKQEYSSSISPISALSVLQKFTGVFLLQGDLMNMYARPIAVLQEGDFGDMLQMPGPMLDTLSLECFSHVLSCLIERNLNGDT